MRAKDIKVGGEYYTYVSGERVLVRVVYDRKKAPSYGRGRYQVERVDNGKLLTKWRSPQALHPTGEGPWPGMTEKQETLDQAEGEYEYPSQDELYESVIIQDARGGKYNVITEGKIIFRNINWDKAVRDVRKWMDRNKYWPDIYYINERGNVDLLNEKGEIIQSWV